VQGSRNWGNTQDIPFTVTGNRVAFTYPTAGQQNVNTITPVSWSPATNAQAYQLTIGTKPGVADLVNSGILAPNVTSYREPALPTGKTLYAKIVLKINGSWSDYQAISFTAAPNPVAFTHPTQGQTGVITPATFTWSTTPAATGYQFWIGTRHGDGSLLKSGWLKPSTSSYPVPALPAGQTLYARIYTGVASGWGDYQDISSPPPPPAPGRRRRRRSAGARSPTSWPRSPPTARPRPGCDGCCDSNPTFTDPRAPDTAEPASNPPAPRSLGKRHPERLPDADTPALARPQTHRSRVARLHNRSAREATVMPAGAPPPVSRRLLCQADGGGDAVGVLEEVVDAADELAFETADRFPCWSCQQHVAWRCKRRSEGRGGA
jgi:hypothetical protein